MDSFLFIMTVHQIKINNKSYVRKISQVEYLKLDLLKIFRKMKKIKMDLVSNLLNVSLNLKHLINKKETIGFYV